MDAYTRDSVVPDQIQEIPPNQLKVCYNGIDLTPGATLTPLKVSRKPDIVYDADPNSFYTLVMNDLDAPTRKDRSSAEVAHWLVVNIPGNDIKKGEEKIMYVGSLPPIGSGPHRYSFLLFKQPEKREFPVETLDLKLENIPKRLHKKISDLMEQGHFDAPIAGNFFFAEYDKYVDIKRAELGFKK